MEIQVDWKRILCECKSNVQLAIKPCLKTIEGSQPNLGMGAGGDMMKPVDLAAEIAIVQTLQKYGVSFTLISEESGIKEYGPRPKSAIVVLTQSMALPT
jgi:fructose-1,6-bisphosphatase/inositol monophosphatase family enzyme